MLSISCLVNLTVQRKWYVRKRTGDIDDGQDFPLLFGLVQLSGAIRLSQNSKHHRPSTGKVRQENFAQLSRQCREPVNMRQGPWKLVIMGQGLDVPG
jgi:hypothetical protein